LNALLRLLSMSMQVGVTFNPQSTLVGTASMDTSARLWDVETGKEVSSLQVCIQLYLLIIIIELSNNEH